MSRALVTPQTAATARKGIVHVVDEVGQDDIPVAAATGPATQLVGGLLNGLSILDLFTLEEPVLGVGEMARRLGVHKSSASRLAATLSTAGYLQATDRPGRYQLGAKLVRLAGLVPQTADLSRAALPILRPLVKRIGDTGHLVSLDGAEVVTLAVVEGWRNMRMHSVVGKRSPAHATATGRALLASLPPESVSQLHEGRQLEQRTPRTITTVEALLAQLELVRAQGFAFDDEELEPGLRCVAAPVFDHAGRAVAAIGISAPASRLAGESVNALAADVKEAAAAISLRLGAATDGMGRSPA